MKNLLAVFIFIMPFQLTYAQTPVSMHIGGKQYMQITTVESVINGGFGRSRMIITNPDGSSKEKDLENLFSITGINFKNIKENETQILTTLKEYTDAGWVMEQVIPFALSPSEKGTGIFMTRYLLAKTDDNKIAIK